MSSETPQPKDNPPADNIEEVTKDVIGEASNNTENENNETSRILEDLFPVNLHCNKNSFEALEIPAFIESLSKQAEKDPSVSSHHFIGMKSILSSSSSCLCRICQSNTCRERLISPCHCKGSLAYVHLSCLERWLSQSSRDYCELCLYHFNAIQSQRYSMCESLRLWMRHPSHRHNLQSDIMITCLLTIVTAGLIAVCLLGMQYFVLEGYKVGISIEWTRGVISAFLIVIMCGYFVTLYLLIKDQFLPWYRWWRQTANVRLVITPTSGNQSNPLSPV